MSEKSRTKDPKKTRSSIEQGSNKLQQQAEAFNKDSRRSSELKKDITYRAWFLPQAYSFDIQM
jgi:hypothetical protein